MIGQLDSQKSTKKTNSDNLQIVDSTMMDVARSVVVKLVLSIYAFSGWLEIILICPIENFTGARFILSHPWYDHGSATKVTLGNVHLQGQKEMFLKII